MSGGREPTPGTAEGHQGEAGDIDASISGRRLGPIGFGCASMMGRASRRQSLVAMNAAFERGVRYFDVARSYGYGRAEALLGEFLKGRRDACVVATKLGIAPAMPGVVSRVLLPALRPVARRLPALQRLSSRRGERLSGVQKGQFGVDAARESLDTSLRELGVDHVDVLLLHEVSAEVVQDEALMRFLDDAVSSGKVGVLGVATGVREVGEILAATSRFQVVQVPSRVGTPALPGIASSAQRLTITHSALGVDDATRSDLTAWLMDQPSQLARLRDHGLVEGAVDSALPELLLAWAVAENQGGLVLSGMIDPRHIEQNLETARRAGPAREVVLSVVEAWRGARA